ncbi:hypothetical protein ACLQ22_02880 [Micromonospora sp. DT178]|uniref:hypothetical protein n=1 Tax=Micromonospora sp. DT178 TaxID=3393436 RepID=UPI003CF8AA58
MTEVETASMAVRVAVQAGLHSRQLSQSFSLRNLWLDVDRGSLCLTESYWAETRMSKAKAASLDAYLEGVQSILQRPGLAALWWITERPGHLQELEEDAFKNFVAGQKAVEVDPSAVAAADPAGGLDEAGTALVEFVNRLEDPGQRSVMAGMLNNLLMLVPAAGDGSADDSRLEG